MDLTNFLDWIWLSFDNTFSYFNAYLKHFSNIVSFFWFNFYFFGASEDTSVSI